MKTLNPSVILVDDNAIFRMIFATILTNIENINLGFSSYENALDAIDGLKSEYNEHLKTPDYLFVDINMPYMSGWELMDKLKEKDFAFLQKCKIYIISSSNLESDMQKIHEYPFIKDYIQKPVNKEKLIEILALP